MKWITIPFVGFIAPIYLNNAVYSLIKRKRIVQAIHLFDFVPRTFEMSLAISKLSQFMKMGNLNDMSRLATSQYPLPPLDQLRQLGMHGQTCRIRAELSISMLVCVCV